MQISGQIIYWRGPSPYHFLPITGQAADEIRDVAPEVSYGWGVIPVEATCGATTWTTSLWPKDGDYLLPIKTAVRRDEGLELGDRMTVELRIGASTPARHR